ncbi:NUDIX hydrolase [Sphingomonas sp. CGMCC 1.13654]|uniref:NUDIX hydrolase n=2 Tax=Sphingomonas chungangi TaxID=2683589 RepID=A0A838L1P1_9SPHN|nr:NUDIX hydrolase [Sphingomonas chungangi]MBA2932575.1 NUDIX hydrolase [Sphingomonas chungangi]MVW56198.1 NUDIX domain-containing protein [Sphingomonas chungangi]
MDAPQTPPIDAASLILMRERVSGDPEYLIVQRGSGLVFAAGAYVFPGGRVDPEDRARAGRDLPDIDPVDAAARIATIRETAEETGIDVEASPADLIPFARWLPVHEEVIRRFDTRFYLACIDRDVVPVADGEESSQAFWATARDVLDRCARGDGRAIFPTRRLLERLARFGSFEEARTEAERLPPRIISPWVEQRDGERWLCIPDDAGYPVTSEALATAFRY